MLRWKQAGFSTSQNTLTFSEASYDMGIPPDEHEITACILALLDDPGFDKEEHHNAGVLGGAVRMLSEGHYAIPDEVISGVLETCSHNGVFPVYRHLASRGDRTSLDWLIKIYNGPTPTARDILFGDIAQLSARLGLQVIEEDDNLTCLLYTSPSPRDQRGSRMPSSA